jgi:hypothetical protein
VAIADAVGGKLLHAEHHQVAALRLLAGGVELHTPSLGPHSPDLEFYTQPLAQAPRPPVAGPADRACPRSPSPTCAPRPIAEPLGDAAELRLKIYTPAASEHADAALVVFHSAGRELVRVARPALHTGHVLVVTLPDRRPLAGHRRDPRGAPWSCSPTPACATPPPASPTPPTACSPASSTPTPRSAPSSASGPSLAVVRSAVLRLRQGPPGLAFALVEPGPPGVDLLGLRLFPTADGARLSCRELAARMTRDAGRLRVVTPDAAAGRR